MTSRTSRTALFEAIRETALNSISDMMARVITKNVEIPGLGRSIPVTYTVEEIDEDWVSVIVDHQYDSDPLIYGNHPNAVGALRDLLPDEYPQRDYPQTARAARDAIVSMLAHHNLGGIVIRAESGRSVDLQLPGRIQGNDWEINRYVNQVREYLPIRACVHLDPDTETIRIHPVREDSK